MKLEYQPKYPFYIVSKGRHESMVTSRTFADMKKHHFIVIEPQDEENYENALDNFGIREYVTLLIAPFSNHGDGPGRARNWCWDHSMSIGAEAHWVFDDNIDGFYRLHKNHRIRIKTPSLFRACEDFVDRYENVPLSGLQYRMFAPPDGKLPPFVANCRIYSALLIKNDCPHRWRGRYNEDTDLSLRVLKDGLCTIQFNILLQEKMVTQALAGGNTDEFYHAENSEAIEKGWNALGTYNKSKMLKEMHPDVAKVVWRFNRIHHHVDYSPFKKNLLKLKKGVQIKEDVNNYGIVFAKVV